MNDKQFEQARKQLIWDMRADGYGWIDGNYIEPPREYELRQKELSCIDMVNSILVYGGFGYTAEEVLRIEERSYHNYLADYVELLGREKVVALIQGQIDSIDRVQRCVFTDGEGCTYNSIIWKDEEEQ